MENSQNIESASQNPEQNDDEISLLDLIAVLLHMIMDMNFTVITLKILLI